MRWVRVVLAALALGAGICRAGAASAQSAPPSTWRPEVGVGIGVARPFGDLEGPASTGGPADPVLSHAMVAAVPLTLGVGLRRGGAFYAGLSGAFAYVLARGDAACPGPEPCVPRGNGHAFRAALDAQYRFRPDRPIGPWLGLRGGLEWLTLDTVTYRGFPFVDAEAGVTVLSRAASTMGFYLGLALGRFVHADEAGAVAFTGSGFGGSPPPPSRTIDDPAWHGWVELGVRGTVDF